MKGLLKYLLFVFLLLVLTNCASSFYTLSPDESASLDQGREIIEKEDSVSYSWLSFEDYTDNEFVFHVFIYNKEQDEFVFNPADISIKYYDNHKNLLSRKPQNAIDPEEQIESLNYAIEEREKSHDVSTGLNVAFALLSTVVDLTDDNDNDAGEVLENVVIFTDNQINEEIDYENDIDYLKANKRYWKNEVLRKTELSKDESVDGIFYIPFNKDAKFVKVSVPIGNSIHTYKFQQFEH